ncbi:cysteine-rich venom protein Mr30-like isoform X2 [Gigantopelta aegis]|uniref:cysteine-rich venom protein Mr30-like isoform X2 n=1 Tax=Gigantopelta aegis TaxID=1735272 RepID=UPI001B88DC1B|nr:cysteine-rich venom protein Mr30-like isoform X2 [Gigantopelta aegis]
MLVKPLPNLRNREPDCGGKLCLNDGTLHVGTCRCQCTPLYRGPVCENKYCPRQDAYYCNKYPMLFCLHPTIHDSCPKQCGVCPKH